MRTPSSRTPAISRRGFIYAAGVSPFAAPFLSRRAQAKTMDRPNILWITTEDICPDLHCYGDAQAITPTIDRFATEGARYTNAFSIAGVCAPSRSAIITGMYPTTIGTHHMRCQGVPPPYVHCFTETLRAAGYYCSNNVKTDYNFDPPLTAWDESSNTAHWRKREKNQPFFSVINFITTHESKIRASEEEYARLTRLLKPEERHQPEAANIPPYYPDTPLVRNDWARYYDLITAMDKQVAEILQQLEEDGLAENTIVFFYGDNGRGLPRAKRWIYDAGLHIPLIVRWPGGLEPGMVIDDLVSFIDFGPTVLSLAGVEVPKTMQGRPFLGEQAAPPREYVFAARDRMDETYDIIRAVRDKRFKYIRNYQACKPYAQYIDYMEQMPTMKEMRRLNKEGTLQGPERLYFLPEKPEEELYDTQNDPHEIHNLAGDPAFRQVLEHLRAVHEKWRDETQDLGLIPEDELKERARPGGVWSITANPRVEPVGGKFQKPVTVSLLCSTEGSSIAYTLDKGENPHWLLYRRPFTIERNARLRTKACRLGFKDSEEISADFSIG